MDRYKQSELAEALDRANIRAPLVWRGQGFRDGGEDCERFRRAVYDGKVRVKPSLLLRAQYVKDLSFENPRAPQSLIEQKQPQLTLNVSVASRQSYGGTAPRRVREQIAAWKEKLK